MRPWMGETGLMGFGGVKDENAEEDWNGSARGTKCEDMGVVLDYG